MSQSPPLGREIQEYLALKRTKSTKTAYSSSFRAFLKYYMGKHGENIGFSHLLDRVYENLKKPRFVQEQIVEPEITGFITWLKEEVLEDKRPKSENTIRQYIAALQHLLKYYNIVVSMNLIENYPRAVPLPTSTKHEWKIEQIKDFVNAATTFRDKAIILCLFQSGMRLSDLVSLNYGDIAEEFETSIIPLHFLVKKRGRISYRTFIGNDAVRYLRLYLQTRQDLNDDSPLFTLWGSERRITEGAIQGRLREIAKSLDFIKEADLKGWNPARPHSLREAFISHLSGKIDGVLIQFWSGHNIGQKNQAYLEMPTKEMRKFYTDIEKHLTLGEPSSEKIIKEIEQAAEMTPMSQNDIDEMNNAINDLLKRNTSMSWKYTWAEREIEEMKNIINDLSKRNVVLENNFASLIRRIDRFGRIVDLAPEEVSALSVIIRDYIEEQNKSEMQEEESEKSA